MSCAPFFFAQKRARTMSARSAVDSAPDSESGGRWFDSSRARHHQNLRRLTNSERKRRQRAALFRIQGGLCHWCNGPMRLVDRSGNTRGKDFAWDEATIDHLDDRFSPERGQHAGEYRHVLAHRKCNWDRGRASQAARPIEELRARATRHRGPQLTAEAQMTTTRAANVTAKQIFWLFAEHSAATLGLVWCAVTLPAFWVCGALGWRL
jgi:hypothetical protein